VKSSGRRKEIVNGAINWFELSLQRAMVGCYDESSNLECPITQRSI
jgi:hypothetical protein